MVGKKHQPDTQFSSPKQAPLTVFSTSYVDVFSF